MPDVKTFNIDGTNIDVKDETARLNSQNAMNTANQALVKVQEIEALERLTITYTGANETITFTRETHQEVANNG